MSDALSGVIILPHMRVQNANAVSGPLSWGTPAISAFTGFTHALQRKLDLEQYRLDGVGVVCHSFQPQVYRPSGRYHWRFCLGRHPMGKDGKPMGTVEEGRAHLEISLVIGVHGDLAEENTRELLAQELMQRVLGMRLAGGSLMPRIGQCPADPKCIPLSPIKDEQAQQFKELRRWFMPGFALIDRSQMMREHLEEMQASNPDATALDALLDLSCLKVAPLPPEPDEKGSMPETVEWQASGARTGWLVPMPIGYAAISKLYEPGVVKNTRDRTTPFRFVEAVYSMGEWISPHRLDTLGQMIWRHEAEPDEGLYLCKTIETKDSIKE